MQRIKKVLFKEETDLGINCPTDYYHMKLLRLMLMVISSWPQKELGEPQVFFQKLFLKYFYLFSMIGCLYGGISFIVQNFHKLNFLELGHMYIVALMTSVNISRIYTLSLSPEYRKLAKVFLTEFHLFYYKERSTYAMKTHKMVHVISHLFTLFLAGQMVVGLCLFNLIPMYNNYAAGRYKKGGVQNSTFEHSLYFAYPFDFMTNVNGYIVTCISHWIISYLCATWFCMFDLILSLMVFNLWGHFKILTNILDNFPRPSSKSNLTWNGSVVQAEKYSKEELKQVFETLRDCIIYHRQILHFTNTMSDVFGPMLFIYYAFHQASGCLLLLECSQMTAAALMRYLPLTLIVTQQLIQLSVIFELVGSESEKIKDAVYGVPWESMDCANRRTVIIFLMNVQEPVHIKALGLANVGVTTMAAILKTSLSYFTFLRSM
uniref:Odorant receptor n=1 Tax=Athetis lepigone TaxID=1223490 RepID=A0A1B3B718_ATHLE|nr:putative odorant receptor OR3 [Athetis lepigone]